LALHLQVSNTIYKEGGEKRGINNSVRLFVTAEPIFPEINIALENPFYSQAFQT